MGTSDVKHARSAYAGGMFALWLAALALGACDAANPEADDEANEGGQVNGGSGAAPSGGTPSGGAGGAPGGTGGTAGTPAVDECTNAAPPTPSPPAGGANFPFPQNRFTHCMLPAGVACAQRQNAQILTAYNRWRGTYVTPNGAGGNLRVARDASNGTDTVSEGIAYGMLLAVYLNDKQVFDGTWAYAKAHRNGRGFMNWRINADGTTAGDGANGATDADEDMAWALLQADKQWGGAYLAEAQTLIQAMYASEVEANTYVLKPGDAYGGSTITNPSYFAPSYYRVFAEVTGQAGWTQVLEKSYAILGVARNPQTGLVPDWCTANGTTASGRSFNYGYDACRTPFRIALDFCQNGEPRAGQYATLVAAFFDPKGPTGIQTGYALNGMAVAGARYGSMAFTGPAAVAALADSSGRFASFVRRAQESLVSNSASMSGGTYTYYDSSWALLSMLVISGNFLDYRRL